MRNQQEVKTRIELCPIDSRPSNQFKCRRCSRFNFNGKCYFAKQLRWLQELYRDGIPNPLQVLWG